MSQEGNKHIQIVCWVDWAPEQKGAFLAEFRDSEGDKIGTRWLPYSQVMMRVGEAGGFTVRGMDAGEEIAIDLPKWLADKDDIAPLIRDQLLEMEAMDEQGEGDYDEKDEDEGGFDDDIPF